MNAPIFAILSAAGAAVAAVSFVSAPLIGAHDGGAAYLVVMATAAFCTLASLVCAVRFVAELIDGGR